jgi:hypothetical protein
MLGTLPQYVFAVPHPRRTSRPNDWDRAFSAVLLGLTTAAVANLSFGLVKHSTMELQSVVSKALNCLACC